MMCSQASIDSGAENLYEIYSTEVAEKTLVFLLFILTAAAGQNSSDLYSTLCMHIAGTDCAVKFRVKSADGAKSDASQKNAGAASHEMVANSPLSPLQHGWAV